MSYGIYLWHLFAIEVCLWLRDLAPLQFLVVTLGLTVLAAAASWHFFEKPILAYGRKYRGARGARAANRGSGRLLGVWPPLGRPLDSGAPARHHSNSLTNIGMT